MGWEIGVVASKMRLESTQKVCQVRALACSECGGCLIPLRATHARIFIYKYKVYFLFSFKSNPFPPIHQSLSSRYSLQITQVAHDSRS